MPTFGMFLQPLEQFGVKVCTCTVAGHHRLPHCIVIDYKLTIGPLHSNLPKITPALTISENPIASASVFEKVDLPTPIVPEIATRVIRHTPYR